MKKKIGICVGLFMFMIALGVSAEPQTDEKKSPFFGNIGGGLGFTSTSFAFAVGGALGMHLLPPWIATRLRLQYSFYSSPTITIDGIDGGPDLIFGTPYMIHKMVRLYAGPGLGVEAGTLFTNPAYAWQLVFPYARIFGGAMLRVNKNVGIYAEASYKFYMTNRSDVDPFAFNMGFGFNL